MNRQITKGMILAGVLVGLAPGLAWAGGQAIVVSGEGQDQMLMEYDDNNRVRMNMPQGEDNADMHLLVRDGGIYYVMVQDGQPMVFDAGSMMQGLSGLFESQDMLGDQEMVEFISLDDTGRNEEVAGISGDVYELRFVDGNGSQQVETLVLSRDARARELSGAFLTMSSTMLDVLQQPQQGREQFALALEDRGMLRYGSDFRVVSFDDSEPAVGRFELPAEPTGLGDLLGGLSGLGAGTAAANADTEVAAESNEGGGIFGSIFGRKVERQQDRQESRTNQAVDRATDRTVDKAVDRVFSIFK